MSRKVLGIGIALLLLIGSQVWAAAFIQYLALQGDGTGSVIVDSASGTAIIHDGGRAESGIPSASIDGVSVLEYLSRPELGIHHLVISCSHPHADHIDGLKTLVSSPEITRFSSITFIDTIPENSPVGPENPNSLFDLYTQSHGSSPQVRHELLLGADGKIRALETALSEVRVTNYSYSPKDVGETVHDAAVINEYTLTGPQGKELKIVDFDDSSKKLINRWAAENKAAARARNEHIQLEAVVLSHHGSRYNDMSAVLGVDSGIEVHSVIATANAGNKFLHPHPEALAQAIQKVGPKRVFVTGSQAGDNVVITDQGVTSLGGQLGAQQRLEALVAARIERDRRVRSSQAPELTRVKAERDLEGLEEVQTSISAADRQGSYDDGVASFAAIVSEENAHAQESHGAQPEGEDHERFGPPWLKGDFGSSTPGAPVPNPTGPTSPPTPAPAAVALPSAASGTASVGPTMSGTGYNGGGGGGGLSPRAGGAAESGGGAGGGGSYITYSRNVMEIRVAFGGVLIGSQPRGPDIDQITYTLQEDGSVLLTISLKDGTHGTYGPISQTELWTAYNFIQPSWELQAKYPGVTLVGDAGGLVGMVGQTDLGDTWQYAINPAIANTSIARDAMRLDKAVSVATPRVSLVSNRVRALPWRKIGRFITYQWYDDAAEIVVSNNKVSVLRASDHQPTLMVLRLIGDPSIRSDADELKADLKINTEVMRRLAVAKRGSDYRAEDGSALKGVIENEVEAEQEKTWTSTLVGTDVTDPICRGLPFVQRINSLAATVALLHLYRDQTHGHLPPLSPAPQPKFERVEAQLSDQEVFER
jgi:hypothetical protein